MIRTDCAVAAISWLEHRKWSINDQTDLIMVDPDSIGCVINATQKGSTQTFVVIQHSHWFDPLDFVDNDFICPALADQPFDYINFSTLVFNSCRAYAVFIKPEALDRSEAHFGRVKFKREDLTMISCPWRIWAFDCLPEWLQRGWPNPVLGKRGETGKPETWQFHPEWCEQVMIESEPFNPLPLKYKPGDWRDAKWYKSWIADPDELTLPWSK